MSGHGPGAHHRAQKAGYAGNPGRSAEIAGLIRDAGADGLHYADLAAALGRPVCNIEAVLATLTPRYTQVYEDDNKRLYWYGADTEQEEAS